MAVELQGRLEVDVGRTCPPRWPSTIRPSMRWPRSSTPPARRRRGDAGGGPRAVARLTATVADAGDDLTETSWRRSGPQARAARQHPHDRGAPRVPRGAPTWRATLREPTRPPYGMRPKLPDRRALLARRAPRRRRDAGRSSTPPSARRSEPIAIVGIGCRFPGGVDDPEAFWRLLRDGVDAIRRGAAPTAGTSTRCYDPDPDARREDRTTRGGGFLDGRRPLRPALLRHLAARGASAWIRSSGCCSRSRWEALEHAGHRARLGCAAARPASSSASRTSDYAAAAATAATRRTSTSTSPPATRTASAAGRVCPTCSGLHGPSLAVDTACSSSLVAVHLACQSLRSGECDLALAGGVNVMLVARATIVLSRSAGMLAPDGRCKTFDARGRRLRARRGLRRGRAQAAVRRAAPTATACSRSIRGSAVNQDGAQQRPDGAERPGAGGGDARGAGRRAASSPREVDYVEAHGTGTSLGDPIEVEALGAVLGEGRAADRPLRGRLGQDQHRPPRGGGRRRRPDQGRAGAASTSEIPPHLHFDDAEPAHPAGASCRSTCRRSALPWPPRRARAPGRRQLVRLQRHQRARRRSRRRRLPTAAPAAPARRPAHLLALSAKTDAALRAARRPVRRASGGAPRDRARRRRRDRDRRARAVRRSALAVVAGHAGRGGDGAGGGWPRRHRARSAAPAGRAGPPADRRSCSPGQGAQYAGMGRELLRDASRCSGDASSAARRSCATQLDAAAARGAVRRARRRCSTRRRYTQPALFAVEYALAQLWRSWGVEPDVVLGHSVGEYVAACVAGVFGLEDGLRLIAARGPADAGAAARAARWRRCSPTRRR